jgi:hypothetical protein
MKFEFVVRAAMAAAITSGEGRYPSSEAWCSEMATDRQPRVSAHSTISRAAAYRSAGGVGPGARRSKRSRNMGPDPVSRRRAPGTPR